MSSTKYATPLAVELKPSKRIGYCLTGFTLATALLPWLLPWPVVIIISVQLLVVSWGIIVYRRHASLTAPKAVRHIIWDADNRWWLTCVNGEEHEATLAYDSYSKPFLVVLNFRIIDSFRRLSVLLIYDNVDADVLRRLRVRLRITSLDQQKEEQKE